MIYNKSTYIHLFNSFFIIIFLLLDLQLIYAQGKTKMPVQISGRFKNVKSSEKIYLYEIDIQGFVPLDSIVLNKSGKFSFVLNEDETVFLFLRTSKNDIIKLIASPGDKLYVEGSYDKLSDNYIVTGSDDSELLRQIDKRVAGDDNKVKHLSDFYNQSHNKKDLQKIKDSLDNVFSNIVFDLRRYLLNIIKVNPQSLACLTAINERFGKNQMFTIEKNDSLYNSLGMSLIKKYPGNKHALAFYKNVNDYLKFKKESDVVESRAGISVKAPDIVLLDKDSNKVSLSSLKGKIVLVRFWNPSCEVCRGENKKLIPLYKKYKDSGFEVFEVSIGTKKDEWLFVMNEDKSDIWTNVKIPEEGDNIPNMGSYYVWLYGVKSVPYSFLINKEGFIVNKGFKTDDLDEMLHDIVNIK